MTGKDPNVATEHDGVRTLTEALAGPVGLISTSLTALQEVACLLAHDSVGLSQAYHVGSEDLKRDGEESRTLASLRKLQLDPSTEVIALVAQDPARDAAEGVLSRVRESDKPTVACFLGLAQKKLWQAGAIPAARLDETAMRAAAWVRGWDQALISSTLEEQDERLSEQAEQLLARVSPERKRLKGLFTSRVFLREAELMLAEVLGKLLGGCCQVVEGMEQTKYLRLALSEPEVAVVLLDVVLNRSEALPHLIPFLRERQERSLVIGHVCGLATDPAKHGPVETALRDAGMILMPSSAAAARLAGMLVGRLDPTNG